MPQSSTLQLRLWILFIFVHSILFVCIVSIDVATTIGLSPTVLKQPIADTYVASGRLNESFHTEKAVWAGYNLDGYQIERTLFKFELIEIPVGSTIRSAKLFLYLGGTTTNDMPMNMTVSRIVSDQGSPNWLDDTTESISWERQQQLQFTDTNSETISVGIDFIEYQWNIQELVQDWANSASRTKYLGLMLQGNENNDRRHERSFWSMDCKIPDECIESQRPRLELQYDLPPTATPIPTHTPTATPTATPTPPFAQLTLRNDPIGEIEPDEKIKYTVHYQIGPNEDLEDVKISSIVPNDVKLIPNTLESSDKVTYTGIYPGAVITWTLGNRAHNQKDNVSYTVCRPIDEEGKQCTDMSMPVTDTPITNQGAQITWIPNHATDPGEARSSTTRNPPLYIYLPLVSKASAN